MQREAQLPEVIAAFDAATGFPRRADGWKQDCQQQADDAEHCQQFEDGQPTLRARQTPARSRHERKSLSRDVFLTGAGFLRDF